MKRLLTFKGAAAAVILVGVLVTASAAIGLERVAQGLIGLAIAALALLIYLADRRRWRSDDRGIRLQTQTVRRASAQNNAASDDLNRQVSRLTTQLDQTQRRLIATLETARLEAADRARDESTQSVPASSNT